VIEVARHGRVAVLTLAEPERRNALDYARVRELTEHLRDADADPGVGAVLLQANGDAFSAGGDIRQFHEEFARSAHDFWTSGESWADLFVLVPEMRIPVVAAVDGHALGGGCGLVAVADYVLAGDRARFGQTEIRLGLFPIVVLPALVRAVGDRYARELAMSGRIIDATEAMRIGLVHRAVPSADLPGEALATATALAELAPEAMALGKRLLARIADLSYRDAVELARAMRGVFLHTTDLREGVDAFLARRPAAWHGAPSDTPTEETA